VILESQKTTRTSDGDSHRPNTAPKNPLPPTRNRPGKIFYPIDFITYLKINGQTRQDNLTNK